MRRAAVRLVQDGLPSHRRLLTYGRRGNSPRQTWRLFEALRRAEPSLGLVLDCTGHGVPGAIMTTIVAVNLRRAVNELGAGDPGRVLERLNWLVRRTMGQVPAGTPLVVNIEIIYFNSSSSKALMNIFDLLAQAAAAGCQVTVNWHYHAQNESALESGEEFSEDVEGVAFNLVRLDG